MRIIPYNEKTGLSGIINVWNQFMKHFNDVSMIYNSEEEFKAKLARYFSDTVLSRDFLIAEDNQGKIIGYAGFLKSSKGDFWYLQTIVLPDYFESSLPGKLMDEILSLAKKQAAPELRVYTKAILKPYVKKLEELGLEPIQYRWDMRLDDSQSTKPSVLPPSIMLQNQKEISDFSNYVTVLNESFKDEFEFQPPTEENLKNLFQEMKKTVNIEFWLAFEGNNLVGMCYIHNNPAQGDIGTIFSLGVLPSHRHRGIGRALLENGIQSLYELGCKRIELKVWGDNEQALALYKKVGFYNLEPRAVVVYSINFRSI